MLRRRDHFAVAVAGEIYYIDKGPDAFRTHGHYFRHQGTKWNIRVVGKVLVLFDVFGFARMTSDVLPDSLTHAYQPVIGDIIHDGNYTTVETISGKSVVHLRIRWNM